MELRSIDNTQRLMKHYQAYLLTERGLSPNTAEAYSDDVSKLVGYAEAEGIAIADISDADIHSFLATMHDVGIAPRSQARIISGLKSFFKYLKMEHYIAQITFGIGNTTAYTFICYFVCGFQIISIEPLVNRALLQIQRTAYL